MFVSNFQLQFRLPSLNPIIEYCDFQNIIFKEMGFFHYLILRIDIIKPHRRNTELLLR